MNSIPMNSAPSGEFSTLVELLRARAHNQPEDRAYTFLVDGEDTQVYLTYADLDRRARAVAATLQSRGASGHNILLLFPSGLEFLTAFFGCLYAGCSAVPCSLPQMGQSRSAAGLERFISICKDTQSLIILVSTDIKESIQQYLLEQDITHDVECLSPAVIADSQAETWNDPHSSGETLALLQYSSGSTSAPKGVMLSHANLLSNLQMLSPTSLLSEHYTFVSWLPVYHDMGLILMLLQAFFFGKTCVFMSPLHFAQKPVRWLTAISRHENVISAGPNFAYDLCVQKVTSEQIRGLDLTNWYASIIGSDPIRHRTLEAFSEKFKRCGFHQGIYIPSYGLAEATVYVSGNQANLSLYRLDTLALEQGQIIEVAETSQQSQVLVGCGVPCDGNRVVIVDPQTCVPCPPDRVGEIWIQGPSVARGYWNQSEATHATFAAHLANTHEGPFLRTGDLGFLARDQLVVTGRLKDLIIIRGRNLYPQDIETTAELAYPGLKRGFNAAFSIDVAEEERLVIVQAVEPLLDRDFVAAAEAIHKAVTTAHNVEVFTIVFVKRSAIPKTTSGKIQRQACRSAFLKNALNPLATITREMSPVNNVPIDLARESLLHLSQEERRAVLMTLLQKQIGLMTSIESAKIDVDTPLTELGMDSLKVAQAQNWIGEVIGKNIPIHTFFEYPTIRLLAARLVGKTDERIAVQQGYERARKQQAAALRQKQVNQQRKGIKHRWTTMEKV
jgi:acyl-CoA synthetase (AMP-forming)/AMP-acid ligase II